MRTATPLLTCSRITERGPSATSEEISTPRFMGPGCMTSTSGEASLTRFAVQAVLAEIGGVVERGGLRHALLLNAQHHDDVGAVDAVLDPREALRALEFVLCGQERFGGHQADVRGAQGAAARARWSARPASA